MSSQVVLNPLQAPSASERIASVVVMPMALDDIPAVMAIERASFPRPWPEHAYRYELSENPEAYFVVARAYEVEATPASARSHWQRLAQRLGLRSRAPVRCAPHAVVGFAGMWMHVDEAHIATIAAHPGWRRRGIGERLLINLLRQAQRRRAEIVTLEVRVSNVAAQHLYRKYGFEEVGRRKAYYQDNREDALLMTIVHFNTPEYRAQLDALERRLRPGG
ncbi:ribosomal protein S18-alanine N-acetyltransferase [Candidatus Roseilinea sp. NK_OTU-006]|jgi:ribosomal-protein-alanine N-acetyltransferase|uniref:ribosomal protein S18-alanine N-acetyltransferase n=1 Tax=Candidatus Roseilinea sp. NK_OTU-006 TaxID=2704250 RepID=UPI00145C4B59|nr:ribosomal protein S18-alanine N-acetyltransferase [Candidatus Roseilinea sp. NK_OTU-006]